jgi:signal transduction histidine kinase/CheY-like chemotaxis protein
MRTKFIERIVSWPETILRNGIREDTAPEAEKNILRLNLLLVFGLSICLINLLLSVSNQLMFSTSVNLLGCISLITSYYMNKYGKYFRAKVLGIIAINLYLLGINYVEGLRSGQYLFFFPLVLALIFVIDLKKNVNELILTGVLTLATTAFIFILAPYQNTSLQDIPQSLYSRLFSSNLAISLLLSSLFSYLILKTIEAREHRIIEEKNFAETIYDTSLEAVIIVKMDDLMITNCNRRALDIFKYGNKHDLISKPVQVVLGEELLELLKDITDSGVTKGSPWYGNMDFNDSDNGIFYGFVNIVPFAHVDEHFCKISILDITETRLAEFEILQAKERAEKAAMVKARFLSNMSHELRTPLNGIIGTTNILLQEEYLDTQRESLDVLKHASEHMLQLVNDILDLSKLEAGKMELEEKPFNLKEFMQRVAAPFIRSANPNISFVLDVDHDLDIDIISDQTRLQQVLNNLISNANKFTPEGTITIGAKMEQRNSQQVSITFSVSDTGIGILPARQQQIFDSFTQADAETTRKYGGTGLGLSISRHIVEKMGGELEVDSYPGIGSTFFFTIQLRFNSTKAFVNETTLKQLTEMEGNRILLAEDNPMNMMVATRFLKKWKMQVDEACNGLEALELYGKNSYDLLLVDLEMPEMDGASFVAHVRKSGDAIPIIAFTAAVYENMLEDLKQKGFSDFITKPFRPEDLHKRILQLTAWGQFPASKYG